MAVPKKIKRLVSEEDQEKRLEEALKKASKKESAPKEIKKAFKKDVKPKERPPKKPLKKVGRPKTVEEGREPVYIYLTRKTSERFTLAFAHEQIKRKGKGGKIDRSLVVEEALTAWLDKNKY